jgi:hypothetical protein
MLQNSVMKVINRIWNDETELTACWYSWSSCLLRFFCSRAVKIVPVVVTQDSTHQSIDAYLYVHDDNDCDDERGECQGTDENVAQTQDPIAVVLAA